MSSTQLGYLEMKMDTNVSSKARLSLKWLYTDNPGH